MSDTKTEFRSERSLPSGRFVLRIDPKLHAALREAARQAGVSLNDYCARKLAAPEGRFDGPAADVVKRAASLFGNALIGVVAFGSWSRNEIRPESDVDVLVVVAPEVAINRQLYRRWDAEPLWWDAHLVEPLFVHLPGPGARLSGVWAEAAVDGVVLFDCDLSVARRLVEFRRRIAAGVMARRRAHGQPYWVQVA